MNRLKELHGSSLSTSSSARKSLMLDSNSVSVGGAAAAGGGPGGPGGGSVCAGLPTIQNKALLLGLGLKPLGGAGPLAEVEGSLPRGLRGF